MSYSTYLRNKADSQRKILSLHNPTDASQHTTKKRFEATQTFFADGQGKGTLAMDTTRPTGTPLLQHSSTSYNKKSTRPADASSYTAFRGAIGVGDDSKYLDGGKFTSPICISIPQVDSSKYKSASDGTRSMTCNSCLDSHDKSTRGEPKFVDNTIRLSAMQPDMVEGACSIATANHTHSAGLPYAPQEFAVTQHTFMAAPPEFQNQGVGGARIGAYYNPRSGYVENKHGNDLNVNPRRVPRSWVYSKGAPAHLKINDPKFGKVKP